MSFVKWLICPVLSLLVVSPAIAQQGWVEIGQEDGIRYQMNPEVQRSSVDSSVVVYELWLTSSQEINGVRFSKVQVFARCERRTQIISRIENFDSQGHRFQVIEYDVTHPSAGDTPKQDIYGQAFQMACNNR